MMTISIDVSKIDKTKLIKGKNGASYLNLAVFEKNEHKYGNTHTVVQSLSKEERDAGQKGAILGNGRDWEMELNEEVEEATCNAPESSGEVGDDLPF